MLNLRAHVNIYFSQAWEDERTEGLLISSAWFIFIVGQCLREKYRTRKKTEKFERANTKSRVEFVTRGGAGRAEWEKTGGENPKLICFALAPLGHCWHLRLAAWILIMSWVQRIRRVRKNPRPLCIWSRFSFFFAGAFPENSACKKKENRDQIHKGRGFFQSIKPQVFFLTLTSSKAENKTKIHVCKWRCYVKSWFERLWQPESVGYSWTRASEVDITIGTPYTLPCSPCMPAAPSLAGALKLGQRLNSPTILLKSTQ